MRLSNKKYFNCILIPLYKQFELLSNQELGSLDQLYRVLGKHQIFFICPEKFDCTIYLKEAEKKNVFPEVKEFNQQFFKDIIGYNKLMTSLMFYKKFKKYDYLLIYQTDAFVFRDELVFWCSKGYDYIGAPWFDGWHQANRGSKIIGVGNGGFSLRNVSASLRLLKRINTLRNLRQFWYKSHLQAIVRFEKFILLFNAFFKVHNIQNFNNILNSSENEDYYWTQILAEFFNDYKVAPVETAIRFSFDVNPSLLFEMNNNKLPFGCHAWEKYEPEFWSKYIKASDFVDFKNNAGFTENNSVSI